MYLNKIILLLFFTFFLLENLIFAKKKKFSLLIMLVKLDIKVFVTSMLVKLIFLFLKLNFFPQSFDNVGNWYFVEYASQKGQKNILL